VVSERTDVARPAPPAEIAVCASTQTHSRSLPGAGAR
jgi:hypothetical protein